MFAVNVRTIFVSNIATLKIEQTYTALIDRQNQFNIFNFLNLYPDFLAKSVDPDQPASEEPG